MGDWSQHSGNMVLILWARLVFLRLHGIVYADGSFHNQRPSSQDASSTRAHFYTHTDINSHTVPHRSHPPSHVPLGTLTQAHNYT